MATGKGNLPSNLSRTSLPPDSELRAGQGDDGGCEEPPLKKITPGNGIRSMSGPAKTDYLTSREHCMSREHCVVEHVLQLKKFDLDRACKDKSHKLFAEDFQVSLIEIMFFSS